MIVDASAILAMLFGVPEAEMFASLIADDRNARVPAPTYLKAFMSTWRTKDAARAQAALAGTNGEIGLMTAVFTPEHAAAACAAFTHYGKGRGHPAQLNFGDCMVYGFAKVEGEPLLFKGNDFSQTDIVAALAA